MVLALGNPAPGFVLGNRYGPRPSINLDGDGIGNTAAFHGGQDLYSLPGGSREVVAVADGVIVRSPYGAGAGLATCVRHEQLGLWSGYAHMSTSPLPVGTRVRRGQLLGREGATGDATGAHLHLDVGVGAPAAFHRVDPLLHVDFSTRPTGTAAGAPTDPIERALRREDGITMFVAHNTTTGHAYTLGQQYIRHEPTVEGAGYLARVLTSEDVVIGMDAQQFAMVIDALGIPRSAPERVVGGTAWSAPLQYHDARQW
ncbi:M23 family metallopeptidase [Agrococcus sp. SGAir0287]|uniref:M23 family metallopeptidase n=1 Tax=Agrococcus sp. SGAir0287 TaxID=2070347 RepID=UPI0010CCC152|nr:M23 family metallopeptidase [Agrococcus sp. SGAir0287]QCR18412.1 hypothetical protein C1N71_02230 [Agrococcus sp. SGAir0287]